MDEAVAAPITEGTAPSARPSGGGLRGPVLSGIGPWIAVVGPVPDFLQADDLDALARWFGDPALAAFGGQAETIRQAIDGDILAIDRLIAAQLDTILHHPRLQALEASWRGLHWLAGQAEDGPGSRIVVRVLNAGWPEIERDLKHAAEFDRSSLFQWIYEAEFGQAGGEPFGLLIVDHAVQHQPDDDHPVDDVAVLRHLAGIGAAAFVPVVVSAAPQLLAVRSFADLATEGRPTAPLADKEHNNWRDLRDDVQSSYLVVVLPRVLGRAPWKDDGIRDDGFRYREAAPSEAEHLWMSAGYPFAAVVARAMARFGWPADIRGADTGRVGGGLVTNLPGEAHRLSPTLTLPRLPVEIIFTDRQERLLIEAGLMPLGALPHSDSLLFGCGRSLGSPRRDAQAGKAAAFDDSRLATQVNALLCTSRFAHHLKIRSRETIGRFRRAPEIQQELQTWLTGFVNRNTLSSAETRAAHPLYDATVRVRERDGKPGFFDCTVRLQPYFQLDNVSASFDFDIDISPPAA
jgi:type VI secretion system protein ImpD/type VI secretion system protein ImpC